MLKKLKPTSSDPNSPGFLYDPNDCIGRGAGTIVYQGFNEVTKEIVAIKIIAKKSPEDTSWRQEYKAHKLVNEHPNIVKIYGSVKTANNFYLITEYCGEKDLRHNLEALPEKRMSEEKAWRILIGLIDAVEFIHSKGIIHRDIKAENVLLKDGEAKVADLGSSTFKDITTSYVGTPLYMAPEVIWKSDIDENSYGREVDIWSLGILFHELLYGKRPFEGKKGPQIRDMIVNAKFEAEKVDYVSEEARNLLNNMLKREPKERITIDQIRKLEKFKKMIQDKESKCLLCD